jgi:hypothetical protein
MTASWSATIIVLGAGRASGETLDLPVLEQVAGSYATITYNGLVRPAGRGIFDPGAGWEASCAPADGGADPGGRALWI